MVLKLSYVCYYAQYRQLTTLANYSLSIQVLGKSIKVILQLLQIGEVLSFPSFFTHILAHILLIIQKLIRFFVYG